MNHHPKKTPYPCADTRCTNYTSQPNTLCETCRQRELDEWRKLHVQKNDPRRHK